MTLSEYNGDDQSENYPSANMSTIISIQTDLVLKRAPAVSGRLLTVSDTAWSKDLYGGCNNVYKFSCGLDEENHKKQLQDIFSQDRHSNPDSLAYTAVIHFSTLIFAGHGNNQTIAVGERNRGHTCCEHSSVDFRISPCIYTLQYSSYEDYSNLLQIAYCDPDTCTN